MNHIPTDPEGIASYLIQQDYLQQRIDFANTAWMIVLALLVIGFFVYAEVRAYRQRHR